MIKDVIIAVLYNTGFVFSLIGFVLLGIIAVILYPLTFGKSIKVLKKGWNKLIYYYSVPKDEDYE